MDGPVAQRLEQGTHNPFLRRRTEVQESARYRNPRSLSVLAPSGLLQYCATVCIVFQSQVTPELTPKSSRSTQELSTHSLLSYRQRGCPSVKGWGLLNSAPLQLPDSRKNFLSFFNFLSF